MSYTRPETCTIMNVKIAAINMDWLKSFLYAHLAELKGEYICVSNVHTTVTAYEDPEYAKVQNNAVLAIPDGGPLSSVGRKRGYANMSRTAGPSLMEELFEDPQARPIRHYFYGSTQETLDLMAKKLKEKYPDLQIVGMYSPPFRALSEEEDTEIIEMINNADADILWVGLGAPKQEYWMAAHKGKINALMIGVGAGFDYFAGNIQRAPQWMQKCNLEWLYRLMQDPKRLFKRYFHTNLSFIWNAVLRGK